LGGEMQAADLERSLSRIVIANGRAELVELDREIGEGHLTGQRPRQSLAEPAGRVDVPLALRDEERPKERKPLDVVPVRVSTQDAAAQRVLARSQERRAQSVRAGPAVQDDQRPIFAADFDAGGVAAVAQGSRAE